MMQYDNAKDSNCFSATSRPNLFSDLQNVSIFPLDVWYYILIRHVIATCLLTRQSRSHIGLW